MSAPNTDPRREERRHRPAMIALRLSIAAGAALLVGIVALAFLRGDAPEGAETQIDARTGEEVPAD